MRDLIFVVDDEPSICRLARHCLEEAGYTVETFSTVVEIQAGQDCRPSLMLISANLPHGEGLDLCRQIRRNPRRGNTPIICFTADASEEQNCAALEAGADNCVAKPFTPRELMAHVQAALRRVVQPFPLGLADIVIDHSAMKISVRGRDVPTTTLEFRLLDYLARHRGHVFTRDVLLDAVWGEMQFVTPRSVDACVRRVREKIELDMNNPIYLKTIRGIGYRFDAVAAWPTSLEICNCLACAASNSGTAQTRPFKLFSRRAAS